MTPDEKIDLQKFEREELPRIKKDIELGDEMDCANCSIALLQAFTQAMKELREEREESKKLKEVMHDLDRTLYLAEKEERERCAKIVERGLTSVSMHSNEAEATEWNYHLSEIAEEIRRGK